MNEKIPEGAIPVDQFEADHKSRGPAQELPPGAIPADQFQSDEDKYGGVLQQAKAGIEGLERGLTLGLSDVARTKLEGYLPESMQTKPEDIAGRMNENPVTSTVGNMAGGAGLMAMTGGVTGLLPKGASTLAKIGAMGVEGGLFGAGNAVTDYALGDPDLNAQKVLSHIGMGAALGAGLGATVEGLSKAYPYAKALIGRTTAEKAGETAVAAAESGETPIIHDAPSEGTKGVQPTSLQEMTDKVNEAKYKGYSTELPQKAILEDAVSRVGMDAAVNPMQLESLGSQQARDAYKTMLEMPGKEGDILRGYEAIQKRELTDKIASDITNLHPSQAPVADAAKGGQEAIEAFTKGYEAEKKELAPIFEKMKNTPLMTEGDGVVGVVNKMTESVPGIARMFDTSAIDAGTGKLAFKPYSSSWGISKATYNAVKEAVEALSENAGDFKALQNIRNGLDQHINILEQGGASGEIRSLKKAMMDYMQDAVQATHPDLEVREAFKRYAINEQERQVIERVFGASVGSPEFGAISKIKPEVIGDRIFSNTANVQAAKNILPKEEFNKILANWLSEAKEAATDKGAFSSNKFFSFLRRNQDALRVAFADNPQGLERLNDLATITRILPDSPSINPSGTAKTLANYFKNSHSAMDVVSSIGSFIKDKTLGHLEEQAKISNLNSKLAGKAEEITVLGEIKKTVEKATQKIDSSAKSIFRSDAGRGAVESGAAAGSYEKNSKRVRQLSADPTAMMDHMVNSTDFVYAAAPNITQGMHSAMTNAVAFLDSKLPRPGNELPFAPKWEPSRAQKDAFNMYYNAVNDPISVLKDIKHGYLSNQTMEALKAVHPHLLQEMQSKVMEQLVPGKHEDLPYSVKIAVSKFIGMPLDNGLLPGVIAANQAALSMPSDSKPKMGMKPTLGGLKELDGASRYRTRTDDLEMSQS